MPDEPMVVVSMGGIAWDYGRFADFDHAAGSWVVVPGGSKRKARRPLFLQQRSSRLQKRLTQVTMMISFSSCGHA